MRRGNSTRRRDTTAIANRRLPVAQSKYHPLSKSHINTRRPMTLSEFQDFRRWTPGGRYQPLTHMQMSRPVTKLRYIDRMQRIQRDPFGYFINKIIPRPLNPFKRFIDKTDTVAAFMNPKKTVTCIRRHMRREVLHALGLVRRGGSGGVKSEWNDSSEIRC